MSACVTSESDMVVCVMHSQPTPWTAEARERAQRLACCCVSGVPENRKEKRTKKRRGNAKHMASVQIVAWEIEFSAFLLIGQGETRNEGMVILEEMRLLLCDASYVCLYQNLGT